MLHGVSNFHSGGEAVEQQAADFPLENGDKWCVLLQLFRSAADRGSELTLERTRNPLQLRSTACTHHERHRAEDLLPEYRVLHELCSAYTEQRRRCSAIHLLAVRRSKQLCTVFLCAL